MMNKNKSGHPKEKMKEKIKQKEVFKMMAPYGTHKLKPTSGRGDKDDNPSPKCESFSLCSKKT